MADTIVGTPDVVARFTYCDTYTYGERGPSMAKTGPWSPRGKPLAMDDPTLLSAFVRWVRRIAEGALDPLPPYRRVEGTLMAKEATPTGEYLILVGRDMVQVDAITFEALKIGDALRVRCTRSLKAISIDRLVS